jgi:hypothetical protein
MSGVAPVTGSTSLSPLALTPATSSLTSPTPLTSLTSLTSLSPLASTLPPATSPSASAAPPLSKAAAAAANRLLLQQTAAATKAAAEAAAAAAEAAAAAQKDATSTKFMSSWQLNDVYEWENYNLDSTSDIEKVIVTFTDLDPKNLTRDIVDNSILELRHMNSGFKPEIIFFDYLESFKKKMTTEEGIASKKGWFGTSGRDEREKFFKNQLGIQHVVSLLTRDKKPMGICYSKCDPTSSKIEDSSFGARRLICKKNDGDIEVKIAFFPGHPLGYLFFDGLASFTDGGKFMGPKKGKLLKKNNGTKLYDVFEATFEGDVVVIIAGIKNVLSQYSYDAASASAAAAAASASSTALVAAAAAPVLKLEGYATGEIGWNLNAPVPVYMDSLPSVTCLNWNFGQDVVKTYIDDDRPSTCKEMLYTTHHDGLNSLDINELFTKACSSIHSLFQTTLVPLVDSERKVDFIVKEEYKEPLDTECKLYKLRCKIIDDTYCVIDLAIPTNSSDTTRIRIYICYGLNDTSQGKPKIIRERSGLFFGFNDKDVVTYEYFLRINEYDDNFGIGFDGKKSVPKLPKKQFKEIVKKFPDTYAGTTDDAKIKMDKRCNMRKDTTETAFNFSMLCAVAAYNLLLSPNGVVSKLLEGLAASSSNKLTEIKQSLKNKIEHMISRVKDLLPKALEFAKNTPTPEFSINNDMFNGLVPPSSALLGSLPPSTVKPTDFDVVDFDIGGTLLSGIYISTDIFGNASVAGTGVAAAAAAAAVPSIIYLDTVTRSYVIKDANDSSIKNIQPSITVLTPNVGTYVIVGDNGDIRTMRPGIITSLDSTSPVPLTIEYITNISSPTTTTTEIKYTDKADSELHSAKDLTSSKVVSKQIWLSVPSSMIPAISLPKLNGAVASSPPSPSSPPPPPPSPPPPSSASVGPPVLEEGGIAEVKTSYSGTSGTPASEFVGKRVFIIKLFHNSGTIKKNVYKVRNKNNNEAFIVEESLTPFMSKAQVDDMLNPSSGASGASVSTIDSLLTGGRSSGRIRGTRKYQNQKRRGNGNMRRRITRKVKRSRRIGVVHRGGGGRGGKIYRKTRKHVRGGRGGRGCGRGGHRRTIKKYHRR